MLLILLMCIDVSYVSRTEVKLWPANLVLQPACTARAFAGIHRENLKQQENCTALAVLLELDNPVLIDDIKDA